MEFKSWLNETVVYHGSKTPINQWDASKHMSGYYPGFYAWPDPVRAHEHGEHVYQLDVDDSQFYRLTDSDELKTQAREAGFHPTQGSGYQDVAYLKDQGYRGLTRGNEYIVFNPEDWHPSPVEHR